MFQLFRRKKNVEKTIASPKESVFAPGSQFNVLQQKMATTLEKQEVEQNSWVEKEKNWRIEKEKLEQTINEQKMQIQDLVDKQENAEQKMSQLQIQLETEQALLRMKSDQVADEIANRDLLIDQLKQMANKIKTLELTRQVAPNEEDKSSGTNSPIDVLYESTFQTLVEEAAHHLALSSTEQLEIIQDSFYLRRYMADVSDKNIVATMLYRISQEYRTISWEEVQTMWPDIDAFEIRQLYRMVLKGFDRDPTEVTARTRIMIRYEEPTETS